MKKFKYYPNKAVLLLFTGALLVLGACEEEEVFEETRLFRPVLYQDLKAELNTIIVNMVRFKDATGYTVEVSRDSFRTIDYTLNVDTNYVILNEATLGTGNSLLWNTLYQIQAVAHAEDPAFDSKVSLLGNVRTERFPSIMNIPTTTDVIDREARVTWKVQGAAVTKIRTFTTADLGLKTPLKEFAVPGSAQAAGEFIVTGLAPSTAYQIAIYSGASGETVRGWETFTTKAASIDYTASNVINLSESEDPTAVATAVASANDGDMIVVKRGVQYNLPTVPLDKSITIRGSLSFAPNKAILFTTGNWNIAAGVTINHIRFIDLELKGEDIGGDYIFNPDNKTDTRVEELTFDDCIINNLRGIIRIRSKVFLKNYTINNCIVYRIGDYGILTTDTDGAGNASMDNLVIKNSTLSKIKSFLTSRTNSQSILIDACTINELALPDGIVFRWRGAVGTLSNVLNGITITNTIWGPAWDEAKTGKLTVRGIYAGLEATNWTMTNTYATSDFAFTPGSEIPGFPPLAYSKKSSDLWVDAYNGLNFNIKDTGFSGKTNCGDPRWRVKL
ncbi:MAG: DUF4957 domain-containing protein [Haliscomenobacter sp.]|nr:DUF4957 domain-containing protein [Haliscomenobacter sp.]